MPTVATPRLGASLASAPPASPSSRRPRAYPAGNSTCHGYLLLPKVHRCPYCIRRTWCYNRPSHGNWSAKPTGTSEEFTMNALKKQPICSKDSAMLSPQYEYLPGQQQLFAEDDLLNMASEESAANQHGELFYTGRDLPGARRPSRRSCGM